jgi:hypothetical protein
LTGARDCHLFADSFLSCAGRDEATALYTCDNRRWL